MVILTEEEILKSEEKRLDFQSELYSRYGSRHIHALIHNEVYPFDKDVDLNRLCKSRTDSNNKRYTGWFELTTTHPDKNIVRKNHMLDALIKFFRPEVFEAHFEIGKSGLYHYHIKVGTKKYLRNTEFVRPNASVMPDQRLTDIQDGYRYTFQQIKSIQAFDKYINKEPAKVTGWENRIFP